MKNVLLLIIAIAIGTMTAFAQSGTELRGRVTDERNANIEGADVRLRSRSGGELSTTTDGNGTYAFTNLTGGDYLVEVRASGFAASASRVTIQRGQTVANDVHLSVEAINETVSVTGTGIAQTVDETSKAISVLDNSAMETKRETGLSESLRGIPGVRVQQQGSPGALTSVRLRGQRTFDTTLLLDGLRVRDASDINGAAGPLFADLVPTDLDRVEVLRGSGSSIYGSNAIGGAINLVPGTAGGGRHYALDLDGGRKAQFGDMDW